jgi:integrase
MFDQEKRSPTTYVPPDWEGAMRAFLAEKQMRSGSSGTVEKYGSLLGRFFAGLDSKTPDQVTPDEVFSFAYGKGPSGREPSAATINLRLAAVSSLYGFLLRMGLVAVNPCDRVQRTRQEPPAPRGLDTGEIKRLLAAVPDSLAGKRDKAIILTLLLTGRRRSEILNLTVGDLSRNGAVYYSYKGKGGRHHRRELPEPCVAAVVEALAVRGKNLQEMPVEESLFDVSSHGFYMNLRRYFRNANLPTGGVHVLRHSAAKLRRDVGETVEQVSSFLDHSNLAVTTTYLRRLEGEEDTGWRKVAALLA